MPPEQIQNAVETAISQGNLFPWWSYILFIFLSGTTCYFAVYLREKGKNLATKKDIGEITSEIEKVKLKYSKESHKFQVAYSGLLKKRAEVIEELYHLIVDTKEMFGRFVDFAKWEGDLSKDDSRKKGGDLLYEFLEKYKKSRIYFHEEVCDKLQSFADSIYKITINYSFALTAVNEGEQVKDFTTQWVKANKDYNEKIPEVRKIIEEEFRKLLGVEETIEE